MTATAPRLRLLTLIVTVLAAVSLLTGTAASATQAQPVAFEQSIVANTVQDAFDQQMLALMNNARAAAGAPSLTASAGLRSLALSWSNNMADGGTGGVLSHNPNVGGLLPSYGAGGATAWAENVATWSPGNGRDAASVFALYMNSPGHRANILNPSMRFVGIGTVISGSNIGWNTQNFTNAVDPPSVRAPIGSFDTATVSGANVTVTGWALEPGDKTRQIPVHVYIDNPGGNTGTALNTTSYRPDVNNAFGATGNHGFTATLPLPTGTSTVCTYAISTLGADNTGLGCRTVTRR